MKPTVETIMLCNEPSIDAHEAHEALYAEVRKACHYADIACKLFNRICDEEVYTRGWTPRSRYRHDACIAWDNYRDQVWDWYRTACARLGLYVSTVTRYSKDGEAHVSYTNLTDADDLQEVPFPKLAL